MNTRPASRGGPGRPRDPAADGAILRAALDLLVERGVDQTSIERIAERAGVAKMTVYRRWSSKEDLLADAIAAARDEIPRTTAVDRPPGALLDVIEELLPRWGAILADPRFRVLSSRLLSAGPSHPRLLDAYWHHHVAPHTERARAAMQRAQADGLLPQTADVDVLMDMMAGAVIYHLLLQPGPLRAADISRYLRRLLRQAGFALPETEAQRPPDANDLGPRAPRSA